MKCINHNQCKGKADGRDGLCSCCRIVTESQKRGKKIEREYWRENQKPHKPNYFREIEHGNK